MTESVRPRRVVIVDADNPMEEIHGEFFWREDHERIVDQERRSAYEAGVRDGSSSRDRPITVIVRQRRRFASLRLFLLILVISAWIAVLIQGWR
jgi:hypothetical protein